jgi:glycosyltransferase involved in cell wall biosynthesis
VTAVEQRIADTGARFWRSNGVAEGAAPVISVVMPCLNEEATIGACVAKALRGLELAGLCGEVVVADNGSTDRSVQIAEAAGARVVHVPQRGYGNAYLAGFAAARGRLLVMGDSDDTYDFTELGRLITPLQREEHDYVLGSRFRGQILPGAMPWLHQYVGNPVLTWVLNRLFGLEVSDAHSGMRAFTRDAYQRMRLQSPGMEFASELVVNAAKARLRVTEVPITYYPRGGESKLRSFRDGWRHLRFMLLRSPDWVFLVPGLALLIFGMLALIALTPGPLPLAGHDWDVHALVLGCLCAILGVQVLTMGMSAKAYAYRRWPDPEDRTIRQFYRHFTLERGLLLGIAAFVVGFAINAAILWVWLDRSMGPLDAVRPAVAAATLMVVGTQVFFSSFLLSILDIRSDDHQGMSN